MIFRIDLGCKYGHRTGEKENGRFGPSSGSAADTKSNAREELPQNAESIPLCWKAQDRFNATVSGLQKTASGDIKILISNVQKGMAAAGRIVKEHF
jgi:hypothetical protein